VFTTKIIVFRTTTTIEGFPSVSLLPRGFIRIVILFFVVIFIVIGIVIPTGQAT
jgi:hypothetical protein